MTRREAIEYIERQGWSKTRLGLDRTRELLQRLGDPQKRLKFVHVAGSNGKGSTCAMLAAILQAAGYRTGLYTSPYLQDFCERIQVDGENIPGGDLARLTERARAAAEAMDDHPSQFELVTAIGMLYFAERRCDLVVLEVGMGGALDSTNAIDAPEAAVITNIGLEHTEYLGDTLEKIAATKAGVIKPGCSCVCYDGAPEVTAVVKRVCAEKNVPLRGAECARVEPIEYSLDGQRFRWNGAEYRLALLGPHQLRNAAVALETVAALRERGWSIPEEAVKAGLAGVKWPARLEVMGRAPLFILDGGHNPQCAEALAESLRELLPGKKVVFLLGVLADKDYPRMMETLLPLAQEFVCLTPLSDRALPAGELAAYLTARGARAQARADVDGGVRAALDAAGEDGAVVAFGSLYLVGAIRGALPSRRHGDQMTERSAPPPPHEAPEQRQARRALALVWLAVLCVSTASIFVRWSTAPSLVLAAYRKTFTVILLIPAVFGSAERRRELRALTRGTVLWCLLSGVFLALHFWTYFLSVNNTTVAASQVLTGTEVLFVALAMFLLGKERYGLRSKTGIAVALLGALLVAYTPGGFQAGGTLFGNLCGVAAAAMMAGYSLIGAKVRAGVSNTVYTFLVYGTAAAVLDVMVLLSPYSFTGYGGINYLMGFLMAVLNSLMGHSIFNWSLKYLSPTLVAICKLFQPVFSTVWALLLLAELPAVNQLAGGAVVILGIFLYIRHRDAAEAPGGGN